MAETDTFCTSCHEMQQPFQELTRSVHYSNEFGIQASCGNCHVPPGIPSGPDPAHSGEHRGVGSSHRQARARPPSTKRTAWSSRRRSGRSSRRNDSAECRSCHTASAMAFAKQPPMAAERALLAGEERDDLHRLPQGRRAYAASRQLSGQIDAERQIRAHSRRHRRPRRGPSQRASGARARSRRRRVRASSCSTPYPSAMSDGTAHAPAEQFIR